MDLTARRGLERMLVCVPDSFLGKGWWSSTSGEGRWGRAGPVVVDPPGSRGAQTSSLGWA